jgi:hypothetical protein
MIVHGEALDGFIILDNRVETLFLELLPIATEVVLIIRIKKQQEVLYAGDVLFELEITFADV